MKKSGLIMILIFLFLFVTGCYNSNDKESSELINNDGTQTTGIETITPEGDNLGGNENKDTDYNNSNVTNNQDTVSENADVSVETDLYQLFIPKTLTAKEELDSFMTFEKDNKVIGKIEILGYYADQPDSQLMPNHSELIKSEKLSGFSTDVIKMTLKVSDAAASESTDIFEQVHYYFLQKDKNLAYDLYFNTDHVNADTAENIASSFVIK